MCAQYRVILTREDTDKLKAVCSSGIKNAKTVLYARALLLMDRSNLTQDHWTVDKTATAVGLSARTLNHLKKRFVEHGIDAVINPQKGRNKSKRPVIFDSAFAEKLLKLARSTPPKDHTRWTVRLLTEKSVELKLAKSVSPMTIHRILKKANIRLV